MIFRELAPAARKILDTKDAAIVAPDLYLTGEFLGDKAPTVNENFAGFTFGYNRPILANRVHDVLSTANWFNEPGFAKTIYALGTHQLTDGKTLLRAIMRTATTDEQARAWFRRYWSFGVGAGAHVLAHGLLDSVREDAEGGLGR